jgi:predicted HTH domain antitoxin
MDLRGYHVGMTAKSRKPTITIEVPPDVLAALGEEAARGEARQSLVLLALRERHIGESRAAELLGVSRWELHDLMNTHGISLIEFTADELDAELGPRRRFDPPAS